MLAFPYSVLGCMTRKKMINLKAKYLRTLNGLSKKQQIILPHGGWLAKEVQMTLIFYVNGAAVGQETI